MCFHLCLQLRGTRFGICMPFSHDATLLVKGRQQALQLLRINEQPVGTYTSEADLRLL